MPAHHLNPNPGFGQLCFAADATGPAPAPANAPTRILVVEDHLFLREGIIALIETEPDLVCCGACDSVYETPRLVAELAPDVLLLDLRLRDGDAFPLIAQFKANCPAMPVLATSVSADPHFVAQTLQAGARGFLLKEDAPACLINALRALLRGQLFVSPSLAAAAPPPAELLGEPRRGEQQRRHGTKS